MRDDSLWQKAAEFAARAHQHALRKDGKTPYVSHTFRVAMTIRHIFGFADDVVLAAALLHDTIEDTGTDYDDLLERFGPEVADLVALMTKDMRLIEPAREQRYDEQLRQGSWKARLLKLADVYDNLTDALGGRGASVSKVLDKARRALDLAKDDKELVEARRLVEALMKRAT